MNDAVCVLLFVAGLFFVVGGRCYYMTTTTIYCTKYHYYFFIYFFCTTTTTTTTTYYCGVRDDISSTSKPELCNLVGPNLATIFDQCVYENEISSPMLKLLIDAELSSNEFA